MNVKITQNSSSSTGNVVKNNNSITQVPKTKDNVAYWNVEDPSIIKIETEQFVNRSGVKLILTNNKGTLSVHTFKQGDPVVIVLPVGTWKLETSSNGNKYNFVTNLHSVLLPNTGKPSQTVNITLDGQDFPVTYWKYSKI